MTNLEIAKKLIIEDIRNDLNGYYSNWGIESWKEYLDATGRDSGDIKEDVYYILSHSEELKGIDTFTDDCEIIDGDEIISYRSLMNEVRKELGW